MATNNAINVGVVAGGGQTYTFPAATDTLVGRASTDTLTNKTLTSPVINSPTGIVKGDVGLGNVDNTSDANKPVSTATQTALDLKAPLASPTFTGTVAGITKVMVGLGSVDNTSDIAKPVSTATQTALDLKANLAGGTFSGGISVPDGVYGAGWNGSVEVPTKNAVYDKIETLGGYTFEGGQSASSPADATTYYFGNTPFVGSTTEGIHRYYIPKTGTIKAIYLTFVGGGTAGSAETSSVYLRLNGTTDTLISAAVVNNAASFVPIAVSNTALSISVTAGDFIEIKWVTPTWATNPGSSVAIQHVIYIE